MARLIKEIAQEIKSRWVKPSQFALPYLNAMLQLETINDKYYLDDADEIILYFLCNAGSFRGEDARRLKKELKDLVK